MQQKCEVGFPTLVSCLGAVIDTVNLFGCGVPTKSRVLRKHPNHRLWACFVNDTLEDRL